jgi:hypothetical protein
MLANFLGVLPILTSPLCALAFIMCSKSNLRDFKCEENLVCANSSFQVNGRSTVSPGRQPSMFKAEGCKTLFPCENWVSLWKEHCELRVFKWENHSLYEKYLQSKCRNTCILWNSTICVRGMSVLHILSLGELSYYLKRVLPTSQSFLVWGTSPLCKIAPFKWAEDSLYLLEEKHLC